MGSVYIANDERFGSVVAIKETLLMDDSYRKAIEREARLLNSLKHNALPRVSDHFLEDNGQFLVMEYIPGEDLGLMMERDHQPFPVADVLKWADQLLDALDYLHNQSIPVIHRDIKPQNLKLTPRGQIVLLDFGLAKGNPTDAGHQTAAKSIFGYSKNYASLEQIQGTGTDPRSDIYSLAATLYHLLTGRPPEDALTRAMNVLSQKPDPLVPAHQIRREIPKGVSAVLYRCMDLNSDARPATAGEMRQMLAHHEEYASWEPSSVTATIPAGDDLLSQKTMLIGAATYQEGNKLTDVKTLVMPEARTKEMVVRGDSTGGISVPATRRTPVLAAAGLAILACGAALGAYFYDPALFGAVAEPAKPEEPAVANVEVNPQPTAPEVVADTPLTNANVADDSAKAAVQPPASKTVEVPKSPKPNRPGAPDGTATDEDIVVKGDTIYVGNTKIRDGAVQTPEVYIDENGIRRRIPKPVIPPINISREQLRMMTPQQRRKLRLLMQNQKPVLNPPAPSPEKP
jgi:hypothetical protein